MTALMFTCSNVCSGELDKQAMSSSRMQCLVVERQRHCRQASWFVFWGVNRVSTPLLAFCTALLQSPGLEAQGGGHKVREEGMGA